jgi:hypothetical protein
MRSLYESLLSDIETNLDAGTREAALLALNQYGSDARKMFGIDADNETPFFVKDNVLFVTKSMRKSTIGVFANLVDYDIAPVIKDLDIDAMLFRGGLSLFGNGNLTGNTLTPAIISSTLSICNFKNVSDINLICDPARSGSDFMPSIKFDDAVKSITNCKLEIFYQNPSIRFCKIPTLKNVSSSTIKTIRITDEQQKVEWRDTLFNKLFDFGYNVEFTHPGKDKINTVKVNNMTDIKKLIVCKDFYSRVYNEWPYKIKHGAKLSDLMDISGFEKLEKITIYDKKMGVIFENTKLSNCHKTAIGYFDSMLKDSHEKMPGTDTRTSILEHTPITLDGWNVFIVRM